jgi:hypothetical protein
MVGYSAKDTAVDQPRAVMLSGETDLYFRANMATASDYLHLCATGTYICISCHHVDRYVRDTGTWSRDSTGVIKFTSDSRELELQQDLVLEMVYWAVQDSQLVARTHAGLTNLLEASAGGPLSNEQVECATPELDSSAWFGHALDANGYGGVIERDTLEKFVQRLQAWLANPVTNVFRLAPREYGGVLFLEDLDGFGLPTDLDRVVQQIREGYLPRWTFHAISRSSYQFGSQHNHPFMFYPQLTLLYMLPAWLRFVSDFVFMLWFVIALALSSSWQGLVTAVIVFVSYNIFGRKYLARVIYPRVGKGVELEKK